MKLSIKENAHSIKRLGIAIWAIVAFLVLLTLKVLYF